MWATLEKARETSGAKCIARKSPVMIWIPRQSPSREPPFHHTEMFEGEGRSTRAPLAILSRGWCNRRGFVINMIAWDL